jgi:hypothetical protein
MKRRYALFAVIFTTLMLTVGMQVVEVVDANPLPPSWMNPKMSITIQSPQNGTDNALPVFVNFTVQCSWQFSLNNTGQDWLRSFYYVLDGQNMSYSGINFTETQLTGTYPTDSDHYFDYSGQAYLTNLTAGIHSITVYYGVLVNVGTPAEFIVYNPSWSATSQFYVNTETTPSPLPSPQETESFPTATVAAVSTVAVVVVGAGLLVYFKKRKR